MRYHNIFKNPGIFDVKWFPAKRKTGNGRLTENLIQFWIKILLWYVGPSITQI